MPLNPIKYYQFDAAQGAPQATPRPPWSIQRLEMTDVYILFSQKQKKDIKKINKNIIISMCHYAHKSNQI